MEAELFRRLNEIVEPGVRAGLGSPHRFSGGLIVLETLGRRTGRPSRVPLAAIRLKDHILVSTYRGRRSGWIKNVSANPRVRYWLRGRRRAARAVAVATPDAPLLRKEWPPAIRWLLPVISSHVRAGWAFALLGPEAAPKGDDQEMSDAAPAANTRGSSPAPG